jgi:hypothetical protein
MNRPTARPTNGTAAHRPRLRALRTRRANHTHIRRAKAKPVAVMLVSAAAEMMKDVREALAAALGFGPTHEEIERRGREADARAAFRAAAEESDRYREFLEEERRRREEAMLPPHLRAMSCGRDVRTQFAATAASSGNRNGFGFGLEALDGEFTVSLSNPLGGMSFGGDDISGFDDDFDTSPDHDFHAL